MLARIYAELDLVAAECIRSGVFDDSTPPQLAAVLAVAGLRGPAQRRRARRPRMPDARTEAAMTEVRRIWREVSLVERDTRLPRGPEPDIGFSEVGVRLGGRSVAGRRCWPTADLTAGDFVRWVRQVVDFAGQIADAAGPGRAARHRPPAGAQHAPRRGDVLAEDDDADDITGDGCPDA